MTKTHDDRRDRNRRLMDRRLIDDNRMHAVPVEEDRRISARRTDKRRSDKDRREQAEGKR